MRINASTNWARAEDVLIDVFESDAIGADASVDVLEKITIIPQ